MQLDVVAMFTVCPDRKDAAKGVRNPRPKIIDCLLLFEPMLRRPESPARAWVTQPTFGHAPGEGAKDLCAGCRKWWRTQPAEKPVDCPFVHDPFYESQ